MGSYNKELLKKVFNIKEKLDDEDKENLEKFLSLYNKIYIKLIQAKEHNDTFEILDNEINQRDKEIRNLKQTIKRKEDKIKNLEENLSNERKEYYKLYNHYNSKYKAEDEEEFV